ncbi:ACP S-malonyltransferase, partial [Lactobacillus sp. XV13L]|nr:ACP S-malonyltransferase [Lactobacillus sp. XV13L]
PDQIVIGGQNQAVDYAIELLTAEKSLRVVELKVSGAFHTPIMHSIQAGLKQTLAPINWQEGDFEVISTTTQKPFAQSNLTANLTQQLVSTTYFAQTFQKVASQLEAVIEIGPGHTLLGFVKKIDKQIPRYSVDSLETLRQTQQLLGV